MRRVKRSAANLVISALSSLSRRGGSVSARIMAAMALAGLLQASNPSLPAFGGEGYPKASEVDVYRQGAYAEFQVPLRGSEVLLIPSSYSKDSISVSMKDGNLRGVLIRQVKLPGWVPPSLAQDAQDLKLLRQRIQELDAAITARSVALKAFDSSAPRDGKSSQWETRRKQMQLQMIEWQDHRNRLNAMAEQLKDQMDQMSPKGRDVLNRVSLTGNGTAKVRGFTQDASWRNRYSLQVDPSGKVDITEELVISQKTGLDWDGHIVCHTSSPMESNWQAEISPWVVRLSDESKPVMLMARNLYKSLEAPEADSPSLSSSQEDLAFSVKGTVPGTGEETALVSGRLSLQGSVDVTLVPLASNTAFMEVTTSPLGRVLIGGEALVTVGGVPTGKVELPFTPKGAPLRFAGGSVAAITGLREESIRTRDTDENRGFVKGGTTIKVLNGLDHPVTVTLKDRVPFPADQSIRVTHSCSVREDSFDRGILTWRLDVPAGGSREVRVDYTVWYPKGKQVDL